MFNKGKTSKWAPLPFASQIITLHKFLFHFQVQAGGWYPLCYWGYPVCCQLLWNCHNTMTINILLLTTVTSTQLFKCCACTSTWHSSYNSGANFMMWKMEQLMLVNQEGPPLKSFDISPTLQTHYSLYQIRVNAI